MYELDLEELTEAQAYDVDSHYSTDDLNADAPVVSGMGVIAGIALASAAVYGLMEARDFLRDTKPHNETYFYVEHAYEDEAGLSQAEADTIYVRTQYALENVKSVDNNAMVQAIHDKVLFHARQDYDFSKIELDLLERLKGLKN